MKKKLLCALLCLPAGLGLLLLGQAACRREVSAAAGHLASFPALAALVCAVGFWLVYKRMAVRQFGGFTGDLAGWFLQVCELVMLAAVVAAERMCALWC